MLITYPNCMGNNLKDLNYVMKNYIGSAVGSIHILPFYKSSADRGFAPIGYDEVDSSFGTWDDIHDLSKKYSLMFDYMINHVSRQSLYFQDFLKNKEDSPYAKLFIRYKDFWKNGEPTIQQVDKIYKRKEKAPYTIAKFADGTEEKVWCTFGEEQIDLNVETDEGYNFMKNNLRLLAHHGASIIRLDAFAYTVKRPDTNCFFVEPEIWDLLHTCKEICNKENAEILPEIHEHYTIQKKLEKKGYYVYDFALPMLLLNAIYFGETRYLANWLKICPRKQFTTLDTHDGIGIVDVKDLLPDSEIENTKKYLFKYGANVKRVYNTAAYNNLDVYQINCTYYSALGDDDASYLLARAVQFFTPGIPQIYYVGLLAGKNDIEFLEKTKEGRNINRHYYSIGDVKKETQRDVVKKLLKLMNFRNQYPAFEGKFSIDDSIPHCLKLCWENGEYKTKLHADFLNKKFSISYWDVQKNDERFITI